MLNEQKKLLTQVRAAQESALGLYNSGVKISGVVQKLRAAGDELETRVRYIEKEAVKEKPAAPTANPRAALAAKTKDELLTLVLEHNTTPGNSELVLPENPTKAQLIEALLSVAK